MKRILAVLASLALALPGVASAQVAISALPAASTPSGTEVLPIVQGGVTKKATINQVRGTSAGTVTSVSVVSANGLGGSVATSTTTPAITLSTSITGVLKGNGTAISAATSGYWTNVNAITHCYNGTTDYGSISADQATYLGSLYTTAAGQTGMAFNPTSAAGGTNNFLGLYNAYNRVRAVARERDSTGSWTYGTTTFRASNNSTSNRVSFVDGLQQSSIQGVFQQLTTGVSGGTNVGMNLDSTSATPATTGWVGISPAQNIATDEWAPQIGLHYIQAMEYVGGGSSQTLYGAGSYSLILSLDM